MTDENEKQIGYLFTAELQFRLASAVRIATTGGIQPLDLPIEWVHGNQKVAYKDIALREDQADYAAHFLQKSATYLLAVAIKDAIKAIFPNPKSNCDPEVVNCYQVARLIRNAFAHSPFLPIWSIDSDCQNTVFFVRDIVRLDTTNINGKPFDWRHYGGPLALFNLSRFVRTKLLNDEVVDRKNIPTPTHQYFQQGNLILKKIDAIPSGSKRLEAKESSEKGISLGNGHYIKSPKEDPT